jgi:hypothetical protein
MPICELAAPRQLIEDVHVRELAFGSGYVLTGRTSPSTRWQGVRSMFVDDQRSSLELFPG